MAHMTPSPVTAPTITDATVDHTADAAAIAHIVQDVEDGFNRGDADLLVRHFADDGFAVSVTGQLLAGRAEMLEVSRQLLDGPLRDQHARYEIDDLRFLRPDVAIARKHAWATDADGNDVDMDHSMTALYVLVKEGDRWWVAARQNTLVAR